MTAMMRICAVTLMQGFEMSCSALSGALPTCRVGAG
jgi:hypothetical protein